MLKNLLAVKSIQDLAAEGDKGELRRSLGPVALTAIGIGGIIGTGIFVLTGLAAAQHAGPAIVLSFIIAGIGCVFAGLCYAEFASMIPVSGSAYAYSYATLGEGVAWFIGWNLVLEYLFAASTVSVGWSRYLVKFLDALGINFIPPALSSAPIDYTIEKGFFATGAMFNLPAVLIVAVVTVILMLGIRQSSMTNAIVVAIKVGIVVLVIGFGAFYVTADNWAPFIPENTGVWGQFGWSGIIRASGIIFFAYIGFDAVSTAAQEAKNPQRDVPFGILASLIICTVLYVLMSGVLTGMLEYPKLNDAAPVATALESPCRAEVAVDPGDLRRARRPDLGDPGHDAGAIAHLLFDVARRTAAAAVPRLPSRVEDPGVLHRADRHRRRPDGRPAAAERARRARVERHAAGVRDGLHRHHGACA